ncbi:MAG: M14 family metallopeptidase, partial [bacterium]|nr:M14 family metallopeptidase [bacterium]
EVEGKEAVQMLSRDILKDEKKRAQILDSFTILILPVLNVDGNEKIDPKNRVYQKVKNGVGIRANGMNMDLNRDFVKMDSPEVRCLVKIFDTWEPFMFIDCHTTNGSLHVEELTYLWSNMPTGPGHWNYIYKKMHPFIKKHTLEKHNIRTIPYGRYDDQLKPTSWGWRTRPSLIYAVNYFGTKGAFSFLNENYAYADFPSRIRACYSLLDAMLHYSLQHKNEMIDMVNAFRKSPAVGNKSVKVVPYPGKLTIMGFEVEATGSKIYHERYRKIKRKDYKVDFYHPLEVHNEPITGAYIFPAGLSPIRDKLQQHGISCYRLDEPLSAEARIFTIESISYMDTPFQGRVMVKELKGAYKTEKRVFKKGYFVVPLDQSQKYRNLVPVLLDPENPDGLIRFGFFNTLIFPRQWVPKPGEFPVFHVPGFKNRK